MNKLTQRAILFFIVSAMVITLPWWISIVILLGLTVYFPLYFEVLFFGFLFDTLYSVKYSFPYTGLSIAFVLVLVVYFVKENIRL